MKKFISMFAFVAVLVLGAFTLASCGDDDDDAKSTILTGTVWSGHVEQADYYTTNITIEFDKDVYRITAGMNAGAADHYTMSSDNKTVYMVAEEGQTIGKISDDGKTMTISSTASSEVSGTLTKQ